jgi:hypothetical protein
LVPEDTPSPVVPDSPRVSPSPSAYREKNPYTPPPPDYKPPSVLAEHKGLAILFAAISIGFAAYCLSGRHGTRERVAQRPPAAIPAAARASTPDAPKTADPKGAVQPIYIETLPEKDAR